MFTFTIISWLVTVGLAMALMAKMTKLSLLRSATDTGMAFKTIPGLWAPEYILLFIALPLGLSLAMAILGTAQLAGYLPS